MLRINLDTIAGLTPGFSGADLANLVNEATLVATRQRADQVTEANFTSAVERIRQMVTSYGMDEDLGYVAFDLEQRSILDTSGATASGNINASEDVLRRIDATIRTIVMDAYHRAYAILSTNREVLDRGARLLLQKEPLDEAAIHTLARDLVIDAGSS